jgi:hypothetical protein
MGAYNMFQGVTMEIEKIRQMVENGFANKRIARILGLPETEVKKLTENNQWELTKEIFSEDKIEHICDLYQQGVSAKSLGLKYSMSKGRIQNWAEERGFLRNKNDSHRFTHFNQHIFDQIDTEEKAYWLGFLYADAYNSESVNTFSLTLAIKDLDHVEKFTRFVDLPLDQIVTECSNGYHWSSNIKLHSKHVCQQMALLGCPQAKSFIIKYPEWLLSQFDRAFIRGLFDGDGCLTMRIKTKEWKWSLVSTQECCQVIQNKIQQYVGLQINFECISKTNNNTYDMEICGNEQIKKIGDWLWLNADPKMRLERKYQKYLQLCYQQANRAFLKNTNRTSYFLK